MNRKFTRRIFSLLVAGACTSSALGADLSQATVREKVNVVTVANAPGAAARPATQGTVVSGQNVVRTGSDSRAELQFTDLTLTRLGSNSVFSFDAASRTMNFTQGAVLFSKPTNSGPVELRAGPITAAITGSTGFISNMPFAAVKGVANKRPQPGRSTITVGMLEGRLKGGTQWTDRQGRAHTMPFKLGPGEMLVAQPGAQPVVVQFDLPRFLRTSPLVKNFSHPLPNQAELARAVAEYETDASRGFVQASNVMVSTQPVRLAFTGYSPATQNAYDVATMQLASQSSTTTANNAGFLPVGGSGVIRGQLVWETSADLDLHLVLPDNQQVYFGNPNVPFNNGRATATLDHDNTGGTIDARPDFRVENIVVNGSPSPGNYNFFVNSFSTPNASDPFTLRVFYNGNTQTLNGNVPAGQNSQSVTVVIPPGG